MRRLGPLLCLPALAVAALAFAGGGPMPSKTGRPASATQQPRKPSCAGRPTGPWAVPRTFLKDAVTVECSDGYRLVGDYLKRSKPRGQMPGVIFLHEDGRDRHEWHSQSIFTAARQCACLALDLRGYGENPGTVGNPAKTASAYTDADYRLMLDDVRDAVAYLAVKSEIAGGRLALVGSGMGANVALLAAGQPWAEAVQVVIAVSPEIEWKGLSVRDAAAKIPSSTRVYLAAAKDDPASWSACETLMGVLRGPKEFWKTDTGGRGLQIFQGHGFHQIPVWLASNLVQADATPARARPAPRPAR